MRSGKYILVVVSIMGLLISGGLLAISFVILMAVGGDYISSSIMIFSGIGTLLCLLLLAIALYS
jgi:hypothetical protein